MSEKSYRVPRPTLNAEHVRLDRGGYDRHGRYWGVGQKLYYVYPRHDLSARGEYIRAASAKDAKRLIRKRR
jgi:hypothetical protein